MRKEKDMLKKMKTKDISIDQYAFETKHFEGANDAFLEKTAPLIGYIVHRFNSLVELLNSSICGLLFDDDDKLGLQVIYRRSYADKVDLFKRLLTEEQTALDKTIPIFEQLISNLIGVGTLRNQVVHADWESAYDDGYTLSKLKINAKGVQHQYVQFTTKSLKNILKLIDVTCKMFDQLDDEKQELYC